MKRALTAAALLLAACGGETPVHDTTDTRAPIAVEYVRPASAKVHTKPEGGAPVVTTWQRGESVSVLARRAGWSEVRTADGSGWVRSEELSDSVEAEKAEAENLKPHFTRPPQSVTQPGISGEIVLEADVNTDGVVTNVRTIQNTTGSSSLEQRNIEELRRAIFTPVVRHGRREPFIYEHRVQY